MSRTFTRTLVALATLASAVAFAGSANAMVLNHGGNGHSGNGGHFGNGGHYIPIYHPHVHPHPHFHYVWWRHRHLHPVAYVAGGYAVGSTVQGTCNCLTKEYTPEGVVVFKDLCTKEMASAPVNGAPEQSGQAADPNNFAGKTYQDYLAANPQAGAADAQKN